ncbi:MAG TPA: hypothetical protein VKM94_06870 [Blastocatellia bacterium]|nr:hypothetical protein [Blastocatellia bacterium]
MFYLSAVPPVDRNLRRTLTALSIWAAAAALITAALLRYIKQPSFWLDEAFVAVSLRDPSPAEIFGRLEYGQFFPRIYLGAIALLRHFAGYQIWSLRLLPLIFFALATCCWVLLLIKRSRSSIVAALVGAALLTGSNLWLDQSIQLKQYTLDVFFALLPFLLDDGFLDETLRSGRRKALLLLLMTPALVSYTYGLAVIARIAGWYVWQERDKRRLSVSAATIALSSLALCLAILWFTDLRFNALDRQAYVSYWGDCILGNVAPRSPAAGLRLLAKFLWGWHSRQPLVIAVVAPLQIAGAWSLFNRWRSRENCEWGSRSAGSVTVLSLVIVASAAGIYPLCAGRLTLFCQPHLQLLAIDGAIFFACASKRSAVWRVAILSGAVIVMFFSVTRYLEFVRAEPEENLTPVVGLIDGQVASRVIVHPCSVAQVRALPRPLPVEVVLTSVESNRLTPMPQEGERYWVLWTHLGADYCVTTLDELKASARNWRVVYDGPRAGLALAEF